MHYHRGCKASTCFMVGTLLFLGVCLAAAVPLAAEPDTVFELNPAQSRVEFTLTSLLHTMHGTFRVKRGHLRLNPMDGAVSGECVVDATSGDSDNHARDRKMHTEVLESHRYPEMVFSPVQVRGHVASQGESHVEVDGTFTIHGARHPLTVTAVVWVTGERFTVSTRFLVPYIQWGMRDPSTFILTVGKQVQIHFEATGHFTR